MPISEEQVSRDLTALKDTMTEFRQEMRIALSGFVRTDVYQAQQDLLRASMVAQEQLLKAQIAVLQNDITKLNGRLDEMASDRKQYRGIAWGAIASAVVALFVSVFKFH